MTGGSTIIKFAKGVMRGGMVKKKTVVKRRRNFNVKMLFYIKIEYLE